MLRRLLVTLFVIGVSIPVTLGLIWAIEGNTASAQERKNCPPGFHWERFPSPIGCVQTKLPAHGKIGYDGYAICEDGYVGDSERRPTTDGKPAPGSPYSSFPYLFGCYPPDEYAQLNAAGKLPSQAKKEAGASGGAMSSAAEAVYDGGSGPSPQDLAIAGLGAGAVVATLFGAATIAGSPPGAVGAREQFRQVIDTERRNELADWEHFKKLDEQYVRLDWQKSTIHRRVKELHRYLKRLEEGVRAGNDLTWVFLALATVLGGALGGPAGAIVGLTFGLGGQAVTSHKDELQDLRVAASIQIERLGQKLKEIDKSLDQLGRQRHLAASHVKATRERLD
jgi:hypothetical protein